MKDNYFYYILEKWSLSGPYRYVWRNAGSQNIKNVTVVNEVLH